MKIETVKFMAEAAGFTMWRNESWKPESSKLGIDWSSDFDKELYTFANLIEEQCKVDFTEDDATNLLKSMGYKVLKPVTEYVEV